MNIGPLVAIVPVVLAVAMIILIIRRNVTGRSESISRDITAAIPAIVVLMVAALLIGSFASTVDDRSYELYDCVPLSEFGSDATISGDCAEIVTIDGVQYVRMTDLGTFTATSGDSTKEYTVGKAHMDLLVLAGQSNSGCYLTNPSFYTGPSTVSPGMGFYLGKTTSPNLLDGGNLSESNVSSAIVCDIVAPDGTMRLSNMYPSLYGDYIEETGHRLMTVSTGVGGQKITTWDDGGRLDLHMSAAMERLKDQCEGKIELRPVAVLWVQGESDATGTEAYYLEHFEPLLDKFEDGHYGFKFPRTIASLPRLNMAPLDDMIAPAKAQESLAETDSRFSIASYLAYRTTSDQMRDAAHFEQDYYGWVGEAFARKVASLTGYRPVTQTIVLPTDIGIVPELPQRLDAYGTSGDAFSVRASWTATGTPGAWTASLSGSPSGTVIMDGLAVQAELFSYDSDTKTLTIGRNVSGSASEWSAYSSAEGLVLTDTVQSVTGTPFANMTALRYVSVPSSLTIDASCFGVSFKDPYGAAVSPISSGEYVGAGDGTVYKADAGIFTYSAGGTTITGLQPSASSAKYVVVPRYNGDVEITGIGYASSSGQVFYGNTNVVLFATVPDSGITTIGTSAFRQCTSLTTAILPQSLTTIKSNAFQECSSLSSAELPDGLTSIEVWAFYGCAITDLDVPDGVTSLPTAVFRNCTSLSTVHIPSSVASIGEKTFGGCTGATSVSFDSGFSATLDGQWAPEWTFYASDGTTAIDKTVASNLAGHTFAGTASALVMQS